MTISSRYNSGIVEDTSNVFALNWVCSGCPIE